MLQLFHDTRAVSEETAFHLPFWWQRPFSMHMQLPTHFPVICFIFNISSLWSDVLAASHKFLSLTFIVLLQETVPLTLFSKALKNRWHFDIGVSRFCYCWKALFVVHWTLFSWHLSGIGSGEHGLMCDFLLRPCSFSHSEWSYLISFLYPWVLCY